MAGPTAQQTTSAGLTTTRRRSSSRPGRRDGCTSISRTSSIPRPTTKPGAGSSRGWKTAGGGTRTRASCRASTASASTRSGTAPGGRQPISQPAHRLQGQAGQRLHPVLPVLRLPAQPRVSHHDHHPGRRHARLPAGAGHFPRHRRPRPDAHRSGLRRHPGALRRLRPYGRRNRGGHPDEQEKIRRVTSIIKAMARFFWFTIEFGLMRSRGRAQGLRQRPAQLVRRDRTRHRLAATSSATRCSSNGSSTSTSRSTTTSRCCSSSIPSITSFELVDELERWMREGRLDNVSPGEPAVSEPHPSGAFWRRIRRSERRRRRCRDAAERLDTGQRAGHIHLALQARLAGVIQW